MTDYQIRTRAVTVDIDLGGGRRVHGDVFLHDAAAAHDGGETILDLMNDEAAFFPLRVESSTVLVAKAQVQSMIVPALATSARIAMERETAGDFVVTVELDDGAKVAGKVFVSSPPGRQRPLDFFNDTRAGFFAIVQAEHDVLVNVARVQLVHNVASQSSRPPRFT